MNARVWALALLTLLPSIGIAAATPIAVGAPAPDLVAFYVKAFTGG